MELPSDHPLRLHSPGRLMAFRWYLHAFAWWRFSAIRVAKGGLPGRHEGRPLVIYSNHPSWWDPVLYMIVGPKLLPARLGFGPMDATELGKWGFFRRLGAFGVAPGRRGAADFLRVSRHGLANPGAAMWITAEGSFTDPRSRPVRLRPGIAHLARDIPGLVLLPLALEYPFWNDSRPEMLLRFGEPVEGGAGRVADWTQRLAAALTTAMDALAQDSASRDASRFITLLAGATQTGLLFQNRHRLKAA